jgi:ATP-dependent exoDNAse (exonuclease V) alpha subunit
MIKEHDCVVLRTNLPENGLAQGDIGTVVHVHKAGEAYEVEFMTPQGRTVAIVTLEASKVRPILPSEVANARELRAA